MEFLGTRGRWKVRGGYRMDIVTDNYEAFGIVDFGTEQEAFLADYPIEEWKANALLISKAPELLEALKVMIDYTTKEFAKINGFGKAREKAVKVIKEATKLSK